MTMLPTPSATVTAVRGVAAARDGRTVLAESRAVVEPLLRTALERLDAGTRRCGAHHLGLVDTDGAPVSGGGGKGLRGALALLGSRAACSPDGRVDDGRAVDRRAGPAAAAVELVHEFSLVHDDLMDGDTERRHRPTVCARWGAGAALLTGDALAALAQEVLLEAPSHHRGDAALLLARTVRSLIAGQGEDVAFERLPAAEVDLGRCRAMVEGKTGALLATAASVGAVLAGAPDEAVDALSTFGAELGVAFQLVDDLLGMWGDPRVTGKPVGSDLRARKKTLPVAYAVARGGGAGRELAHLLDDATDDADPVHLRCLVERAGGRRWAQEEAHRCRRRAEQALAAAQLAGPARVELFALARLLTDRKA